MHGLCPDDKRREIEDTWRTCAAVALCQDPRTGPSCAGAPTNLTSSTCPPIVDPNARCYAAHVSRPTSVIRVLAIGEEPLAEAFLAKRPQTTMILRSNLARGGLLDQGRRYQGRYAVAIVEGVIVGLAAAYWNDALVLAGGDHVKPLTEALAVGRTCGFAAILGPVDEVRAARGIAGTCFERPLRKQSDEILYALSLADLVVPARAADLVARAAEASEMPLVYAWRLLYAAETSSVVDTPQTRARERGLVDAMHAEGNDLLLLQGSTPVAYAGLNATLPEMVQVGGVFAPQELRGRGYARRAVAALLERARERGCTQAILFTANENVAAQRAYEALGFRVVGDYAIASFG